MADMYTVCGWLGCVLSLFVFLYPVPTFYRMFMTRTTGNVTDTSIILSIVACVLSAWYGILSNNTLVTFTNAVGAVTETIYLALFFVSSTKRVRGEVFSRVLMVAVILDCFILVNLSQDHESRMYLCGVLVVIELVLENSLVRYRIRRGENRPFFLTFCSMLSSICWFSYSVLGKDQLSVIAHGCACALGLQHAMQPSVKEG